MDFKNNVNNVSLCLRKQNKRIVIKIKLLLKRMYWKSLKEMKKKDMDYKLSFVANLKIETIDWKRNEIQCENKTQTKYVLKQQQPQKINEMIQMCNNWCIHDYYYYYKTWKLPLRLIKIFLRKKLHKCNSFCCIKIETCIGR